MADGSNLNEVLHTLWLNMGVIPSNRALAVARVAVNHGTPEIRQCWAERIRRETPVCWEREEALRLLNGPLAGLSRLVKEGQVVIAQSERLRVDWEMGRLCVALRGHLRSWHSGRNFALHSPLPGFGEGSGVGFSNSF